MLRRAFVSWLGLVFVAGVLAAQPKPSSDLLLPYFEVDLEGAEATTVFAVANALDKQVDVSAALYTNWGLPVASAQVRLKPREVWAADLHDWIAEGKLPGRKPLTAGELQLVQAMLSGQPSPTDGLYYSTDVADGRATGYLTIRTVVGKGAKPDAMRGEGFVVDPEQGPARGHDLVDIDKTTSKELCNRHSLRHLSGIGLGESRVVLWRDLTGQILPAPVPADRRRQIDVSIYSPQGKLLRTRSFQLLPAEQVPVTELGLTEPQGKIEIATADASVAMIQASEGGPLFETSCVQAGGGTDPGPKPTAVRIAALVNGQDANAAPGPSIPAGATVTWTYRITNAGSDPLTQISVADDQIAGVTCPKGTLNPGQSLTCTAKGLAEACQHRNVGTVTAKIKKGKKGGSTVTAQDPSHYFGEEGAAVEIVTSTNGADANVPTGPTVLAGSPISWTYLITNTGKVRLLSLRVSDDHGAAVVCPRTSLAPGEAMTCEATGVAGAGQFRNVATVTGKATCGPVSDSDPSHYFGESEKNVQLRALVNGFDADFPPGPTIPVGAPVTWEYVVTNSGKFPLNALAVGDDRNTVVSCPKAGLTAGESMTCIARGVASACQYAASATVTGQTPDGTRVAASNPGHYFGQAEASIVIKTSVNGNDADLPPGPSVPIGTPVQWTYTLTNTGKVALSGLAVTDDKGAPVTCPRTELRPGESLACTATGTAVSGDFRNLGTVTARPPCGDPVRDDDPSHYKGIGDPGIHIRTLVLGQDANSPPGPAIQVGSTVSWDYVVTNTGQFALSGILVSDSRGAKVTCPKTGLQPGQAMTCTASGPAKPCQFDNLGTASGKTSTGATVTAVDPSYYLGEHHPGVKIETMVNNAEADAPPGPTVMVGAAVTWTYRVTNAGDADLSGVQVTDDQGAAVSCPKTVLQPGESMECSALGTAKEGQFRNVGNVTASPPCGAAVSAQDPSHYKGGGDGAIFIQALVNGQDANGSPGPTILLGEPVTWTYTVKNPGKVSLSNVAVIDNRGVAVTCPKAVLQAGDSMTCSGTGTARPCQNDNLATATAQTAEGVPVSAADPTYYFGKIQPGFSFELSVNGQAADQSPGPTITVGSPVNWLFAITNTGNAVLSNVSASGDNGAAVSCPKTTLQPGEPMSCSAFGTAAEAQHGNHGTVTAVPACGEGLTAFDDAYYFGGGSSEIQIRTLINFQDIGQPPGPSLATGSPINWSYVVKNLGQVTLSDITVTGDGAAVACPKTTLAAGLSMTCTTTGNAQACQQTHVGAVTAKNASNQDVSAIDPSFYNGTFIAKIDIETAVEGNNADSPKGPYIEVDSTVHWTYKVTNLGNIVLTNVRVVDDQGALVTCPKDTLAPGEAMTCTASGTAVEGQFRNIGTATGDTACGSQISAQDASHYLGTLPVRIEILKLTNGQDVAQPSDLVLLAGSAVQWTYSVKNTGQAPLSGVAVDDDKGVAVSCPKAELQPSESMTCTGSGTATSGAYTNTGSVVAQTPYGTTVNASDQSHYQGSSPSIDIETTTNGQEDDSLAGASVVVATALTRSYTVTNSGSFDLTGVAVTDSSGLTVDCLGQTTLAAGASMTCTATGTSACGNHPGTSTVTATTSTGQSATDSDPSNYTGAQTPGVQIQTLLTGDDANTAPGPTLLAGLPWPVTHVVTNNGNIQVQGIVVTDEEGSTGPCAVPATLDPGQSFTCIRVFVADPGASHNHGTVTAQSTCGTSVSATDPAHYFGLSL